MFHEVITLTSINRQALKRELFGHRHFRSNVLGWLWLWWCGSELITEIKLIVTNTNRRV